MKRKSVKNEGQTLITVAIVLVVLLAAVAIAVDVGNMYRHRRQLQNAADAGALAGAWEICFGDPALAQSAAETYAQDNYGDEVIDTIQVTFPNTYTVDVTVFEDVPTYFAGIVGMRTFNDVPATAAAACGAARYACGLWPIAFSETLFGQVEDKGCGTEFYVWGGSHCNDPDDPDPSCQAPDCTEYWCDCLPDDGDGKCECVDTDGDGMCDSSPDGDGFDEVFGIGDGMWQRAFVDFTNATVEDLEYPDDCAEQTSCGESEIRCWIQSDSGAKIELPTCLPGTLGVKAGVHKDVDAREGDVVAIPIFTSTGCGEACASESNSDSFLIESFGCVTVMQFEISFKLPRRDGLQPSWGGHLIQMAFSCGGCSTYCGGTAGAPPVLGGVNAVSLLK